MVSPTGEAQLAVWGQAVEAFGSRIVQVRNSFALNDATSALPPNGYGMQSVVITHVFEPTKDVTRRNCREIRTRVKPPSASGVGCRQERSAHASPRLSLRAGQSLH